MTNGEKYKGAKERAEAFKKFCDNECGACPLYAEPCHTDNCQFYWLDLEAEEEEPLPCPFCGCKDIEFAIIEDESDGYMASPQIYCRNCYASFELDWEKAKDLGDEITEEQKNELLAKWNNRVARAAKEKEVDE